MSNRRNYFRQRMRATGGQPVQLALPDGTKWNALLLDLSVGGMSIQLPRRPTDGLLEDAWFASFELPGEPAGLVLPVQLVHCKPHGPAVAGFRFVPLIDPRADEEVRRRIAAFLLAEQCRERRRRTGQREPVDARVADTA